MSTPEIKLEEDRQRTISALGYHRMMIVMYNVSLDFYKSLLTDDLCKSAAKYKFVHERIDAFTLALSITQKGLDKLEGDVATKCFGHLTEALREEFEAVK